MANEQPYVVTSPLVRPWLRPSHVFAPVLHFQSRTSLTALVVKTTAPPSLSFTSFDLTFTPGDPIFGNRFAATGRDYLLVENTGGAVRKITVRSSPEPVFGRTGDYSRGVEPGVTAVIGPITMAGWMQGDRNIWVDVETADLQLLPVVFA